LPAAPGATVTVVPLLAVGETGALVLGAADVGSADVGAAWLVATLAVGVGSLTAFP
jgi:hypothetical protein